MSPCALRTAPGVRLLMACLLGKLHAPGVDPRRPCTEIGGSQSFSGRTYDESYLTASINRHRLPANSTTAFLTPTLRNIGAPLTTDRPLVGRPRALYAKTPELLEDVAEGRWPAKGVLVEAMRVLLRLRDENLARMASLTEALGRGKGALRLSSEAVVTLIRQHLACRNASRLPVLIVAAAYEVAGTKLSESLLPLNAHNAADRQTNALGDVETCLRSDDAVVTAYEMKPVTRDDVDQAVTKMARARAQIDNYLFITTEAVDPAVAEYAAGLYEELDGTEVAILDCASFLRRSLHLFHRCRAAYLDACQNLALDEPDSAASQTLKETFLALRKAAETGERPGQPVHARPYPAANPPIPATIRSTARRAAGTSPAKSAYPCTSASSSISSARTPARRSAAA